MLKKETYFAYLVALTVLISAAYSVYRHYDFSYSEDSKSYIEMAQGNYKGISMTHQYRFITPTIAGVVSIPISWVCSKIWADRGGEIWAIRLSFLIENVLLMAFFGSLLFCIARREGIPFEAALLSMIFLLTTRWGIDNAALPLVEALYLVCIAGMVYALQTNQLGLQVAIIVVGCFAKEAFVFELPILLFCSRQRKRMLLVSILLTACLVWASRSFIDQTTGNNYVQEVGNFVRHFQNIGVNLRNLITPKGLFETFSAVGLGGIFILYGVWQREVRQIYFNEIPAWAWGVFGAAVVQGLLGEWGRMLYYACPFYMLLLGFAIDLALKNALRKKA